MKNKKRDVLYCNVDIEKIKKAKPSLNQKNLKIFYKWLIERYRIHIKKDIEKTGSPWTDDKILMKYRFTNVRREHDRETKWVIKNICNNQSHSYENKLLNIILFRLFNKSKTLEIFGAVDFNKLNLQKVKRNIDKYKLKNPQYLYFSNAFFTSGQKRAANLLIKCEKNIAIKIILLVQKYHKEGIVNKIKKAKNQKEVYNAFLELNGIGNFLAYQIFVDLTYIKEFPFSENEFVIAGPGCKKGLNYLFADFDNLSYEETLFWLRDNQQSILRKFGYAPSKLFNDLKKEDRYLNIMSLENCMCELSKYIRTLKNEGRPRVKYLQQSILQSVL